MIVGQQHHSFRNVMLINMFTIVTDIDDYQ